MPHNPMRTLSAGTLVLEPLVAAHAEAMYPLLADPALYAHLDHGPPTGAADLARGYARLESRRSPDGREQWLNWVLRTPDGALAGFVQATVLPTQVAWVAYVVGRAFWGRGWGVAATRAMMEELAAEHGVTRFIASVEEANTPSIGVLGRLGFRAGSAAETAAHGLGASERLFVRDADPPGA